MKTLFQPVGWFAVQNYIVGRKHFKIKIILLKTQELVVIRIPFCEWRGRHKATSHALSVSNRELSLILCCAKTFQFVYARAYVPSPHVRIRQVYFPWIA